MMETNGRIQNVQQKMLNILSDGMPHTAEELHSCLYDTDAPISNIRNHLSMLNKYLRPKAMKVFHECIKHKWHYRLARLLVNPNDGYQ